MTTKEDQQPMDVEFSPCPHCSLRTAFEAWCKLYPDQAVRDSGRKEIDIAETCIIAASRLIANYIHAAPLEARQHLMTCLTFTLNADITIVPALEAEAEGKPPGAICH